MSLQLAAQHLAAQGRGPDKQLVHMSPREVAGLQALAMAHGGSLTINPDTGLPEAGFLDKLLPTIIGAGLMYATGGAAGAAMPGLFGMGMPATIGLGIGALETARTGNLQKGLMAGLGAYGGAGLFGALAGAGAGAAGAGAGAAQAAATPGLGMADPAIGLAEQAEIARLGVPMPGAAEAAQAAGRQSMTDFMASKGVGLGPTGEIVPVSSTFPQTVTPAPTITPTATPARGFLEGMGDVSAVEGPGVAGAGLPTRSSTFASRFAAMPTKDKFKYGLAALSPALLAQPKYKQPELDREQYRYAYSPGRVENPELGYTGAATGERAYFRPSYTRLAAGGPVENMSAANVYDMQRARGGVSDMGVDMSTGMERMADGGITGSGELNLNIPLNFGGGSDFGGRFNQGPLDFGQNRTGFGQAAANGYQSVGSGASSSPPGFLAPKPSSTVGLTENPFNLGTQLASRLGSANQNPFAAQPTTEMMAAQREATPFNPAFDLADLQRRVGDREESFNEFENRRRMRRHPGDQVPTAAELQSEYKDYVQDRNNNLAKIGDLQQVLSRQAQQKEMFDRINAMQQQIPQMAEGGAAGLSGYEGYKGYSQPEQDQTKDIYERDDGNSGGMADRTDSSVAANPATTIAIGQALQGYGNLAFAPGAAIASMLGHGMVSSGINALGAMEAQAATDASNAAAASQANAGLDSAVDASGEAMGMARGGISDLGDYSDGGRLLKGPGDGVSDSIPAMIGRKQPARLADGEFVVPARIVSELGNGSTDAGARKLYAMMDRIQKARRQTVGKGKVAKNSRAEKYLPA